MALFRYLGTRPGTTSSFFAGQRLGSPQATRSKEMTRRAENRRISIEFWAINFPNPWPTDYVSLPSVTAALMETISSPFPTKQPRPSPSGA